MLPQGANQQIRPASSVSTQTAQNQAMQMKTKLRTKPQAVRPAVPNLKNDVNNQTKVMPAPGQTLQQIVTTAGNK